jgi:uncharacterized membrane protein
MSRPRVPMGDNGRVANALVAAAEQQSVERDPGLPRSRRRPRLRRLSDLGLVLAVAGYLVALTPSLVPRTGGGQVAVSVILTLTGYALGALIGFAVRRVAGWLGHTAHPSAHGRTVADVLLLLAVAGALAFTPVGLGWQDDGGELAGWVYPSWVSVVVWTPILFAAGLLVARAMRAAGRGLAEPWRRVLPETGARFAGGLTVTLLALATIAGMTALLVQQYENLDAVSSDQVRPTSELRSGGPGSLVSWESLGRQGRYFVSDGPSAAEILGFTGGPAMEPIRVYVGLGADATPEGRAELAVQELRRTGGLDRSSLVIVITSGLGSIHPVSAASLEYATNGDVATVATQFSRVPSWLTMVTDRYGAERETAALVTAVQAEVQRMPESQRPDVYLFGESLGAYGSQQYFAGSTPEEVVEQFAGVLWVGTPASSDLVADWAVQADGVPAWEPVVGDGSIARFAADPTRVPLNDPTWQTPRILFLHSATDPVVHLSGSLVTSRPSWLSDDRGDRIPEGMVWWPVFTWEQILVDMTTNGIVPPGLGHNYSHAHAAGWVAVLAPEGWTAEDVDRLNDYRNSVEEAADEE